MHFNTIQISSQFCQQIRSDKTLDLDRYIEVHELAVKDGQHDRAKNYYRIVRRCGEKGKLTVLNTNNHNIALQQKQKFKFSNGCLN